MLSGKLSKSKSNRGDSLGVKSPLLFSAGRGFLSLGKMITGSSLRLSASVSTEESKFSVSELKLIIGGTSYWISKSIPSKNTFGNFSKVVGIPSTLICRCRRSSHETFGKLIVRFFQLSPLTFESSNQFCPSKL